MSSLALANFVSGAIAALCWVVGLFFMLFWQRTRDRFFGFFAVAFWLLGIGRLAISVMGAANEGHLAIYLLRLFAYVVFLAAIVDKNRGSGTR